MPDLFWNIKLILILHMHGNTDNKIIVKQLVNTFRNITYLSILVQFEICEGFKGFGCAIRRSPEFPFLSENWFWFNKGFAWHRGTPFSAAYIGGKTPYIRMDVAPWWEQVGLDGIGYWYLRAGWGMEHLRPISLSIGVDTVSKQLSDWIFVQKRPRNKLLRVWHD